MHLVVVDDPSAMGVIVFDSEDAASGFRENVEVRRDRMPHEVVTLDSVEVRTVVAHRRDARRDQPRNALFFGQHRIRASW